MEEELITMLPQKKSLQHNVTFTIVDMDICPLVPFWSIFGVSNLVWGHLEFGSIEFFFRLSSLSLALSDHKVSAPCQGR